MSDEHIIQMNVELSTKSFKSSEIKNNYCPLKVFISSLIIIGIFIMALGLVIHYPYLGYISKHGEATCGVCNCVVVSEISCTHIQYDGEICTGTFIATVNFMLNSSDIYCNHQDSITVGDYNFCDNLRYGIECYYENDNPEGSVQLSYFFPYGGVIGISFLSFFLFVAILIALISLCYLL